MVWLIIIQISLIALLAINKSIKLDRQLGIILFTILCFFSIFRINVGSDFNNYWNVKEYLQRIPATNVFTDIIFNNLVKFVFNYDISPRWIFVLSSTITFINIGYFLNKTSKNIILSFMIFTFFPLFYATSLSIIRQYIAISFFLIAIIFIYERNWRKYLLAILLGFGFHSSIILLLPFYFINRIKFNIPIVVLLIIFSVFLKFYGLELLKAIPIFDRYMIYIINKWGPGYINYFILFNALLMLLTFLFIYFEKNNNIDGFERTLYKIYLFGALLYGPLMFSEPATRICLYMIITLIVLIPNIVSKFRNQALICYFISILLMCYFSYILYKDYYNGPVGFNVIPFEIGL